MTKSKNLLLLFVLICISSCLWNDTAITEDLGDKYFYLGAGNESQILSGDEKKNIGITIIPQEVIEYNFDNRFIIAKSVAKRNSNNVQEFWIVDKKSKDLIVTDSISFMKKIESLGLKIRLKPRK
ncbi:hypothetical protein I5907_19435 [Panacibacter sp. DH6]|uniref:DUF3997 domain-containing protein n=1 Tax=Panacibacter microcysteis TaxID=2793269 RepID=A0A931GZU8_9BACT|nr:DUF3997 domain-containing protein [Panacibacter microcysteis]MBG9378419.1 hypothetical protein [Panacibacter microcysteis]